MPKKHQPAYASIKPTSKNKPSHNPGTSSSLANPSTPITVSERIEQLRREQSPRVTAQRRDEVTEVVTYRTVPPELRRLLHMAEVDAPRPKVGSRRRVLGVDGRRLPPGPEVPSSWLHRSRHAPREMRNHSGGNEGSGGFGLLARAHDEEFKHLPPRWSLAQQCLRTFALHWRDLIEYEQHYLSNLPLGLKEALLSYLCVYGTRGSLDLQTLTILFQSFRDGDHTVEASDARFLDLGGSIWSGFTVQDLHVALSRTTLSKATSTRHDQPASQTPQQSMEVVESWEDEVDDTPLPNKSPVMHSQLFPNLTRLSLARPGAAASWKDLLAAAAGFKTLTHLSLAYWPRPSTTPNATTASMMSQHGSLSLGGSHFYSDLDNDWHEAANILRRLSLQTYCLQWLDLEGCTWIKALTWTDDGGPRVQNHLEKTDWAEVVCPGPDWTGAWRQISYLYVYQGWIPSEKKSLQSLPAGVVCIRLMEWLRSLESREDGEMGDDADMERRERDRAKLRKETGSMVTAWVEREMIARNAGLEIWRRRKESGGRWCAVDQGWGK